MVGIPNVKMFNLVSRQKKALPGTRTQNPQIRSLVRYPLRQ